MTDFGYKTLTVDNWQEPDKVLSYLVHLSPDGQIGSITGNEWARRILEPRLAKSVPIEVQRLFEVARGAMVYGYFFYPLYTLGLEQLLRVVEAAVSHKCTEMGAPKSTKTFEAKINWLVVQSVIAPNDGQQWHNIREFRNSASHPTMQTIIMPGNAIGFMADVARKINILFGG